MLPPKSAAASVIKAVLVRPLNEERETNFNGLLPQKVAARFCNYCSSCAKFERH